jgi:hypothetical protein
MHVRAGMRSLQLTGVIASRRQRHRPLPPLQRRGRLARAEIVPVAPGTFQQSPTVGLSPRQAEAVFFALRKRDGGTVVGDGAPARWTLANTEVSTIAS